MEFRFKLNTDQIYRALQCRTNEEEEAYANYLNWKNEGEDWKFGTEENKPIPSIQMSGYLWKQIWLPRPLISTSGEYHRSGDNYSLSMQLEHEIPGETEKKISENYQIFRENLQQELEDIAVLATPYSLHFNKGENIEAVLEFRQYQANLIFGDSGARERKLSSLKNFEEDILDMGILFNRVSTRMFNAGAKIPEWEIIPKQKFWKMELGNLAMRYEG